MIRTLTLAAAAAIAGYWVGTRNAESDSRFSEPEVTADDVSVRDDDNGIANPYQSWDHFDEGEVIGE